MSLTLTPVELASELVRRYGLTANDLVVEIGSGDGTLLRAVRGLGPRVLGVEPNARAVARAFATGVDCIAAEFDVPTADRVRRRYGPARVLLAHSRSAEGAPPDLVSAAAVCLGPDGVVVLLRDSIFAELRPYPVARSRAA